jgi:methionine biosynthesis protein MetW
VRESIGIKNDTSSGLERLDYRIILKLVERGTKALDLGCGTGELLALLAREKSVIGRGVEIDANNISVCMGREVPAIQGDVDEGLADYPDRSFDYVILNQTLQVVKAPDRVLEEMVRVGKMGIVGFPNFGNWRVRLDLLLRGRMPMTRELPEPWYSTPNIHLLTIRDFESLCEEKGIKITRRVLLGRSGRIKAPGLGNLLAVQAIYMIRK